MQLILYILMTSKWPVKGGSFKKGFSCIEVYGKIECSSSFLMSFRTQSLVSDHFWINHDIQFVKKILCKSKKGGFSRKLPDKLSVINWFLSQTNPSPVTAGFKAPTWWGWKCSSWHHSDCIHLSYHPRPRMAILRTSCPTAIEQSQEQKKSKTL